MRKRTFAKSQTHKQRLQRRSDVMGLCLMNKIPRVMEELLLNRDSKMRRFCNYFLTLFNQKKLNPFTQFINTATLKRVKFKVRQKMKYFQKSDEEADENEEKPQRLPENKKIKSLVDKTSDLMLKDEDKKEDESNKSGQNQDLEPSNLALHPAGPEIQNGPLANKTVSFDKDISDAQEIVMKAERKFGGD
jgi:hypothetical protein